MIVCLCHRVSDRDIVRAAQRGVSSFEELQDETCIARGCECCGELARELFDAASASGGARRERSGSPMVVRLHRATA